MEYFFYSAFLLIPFGFLVYKWFVIENKIEFIIKAVLVNYGILFIAYLVALFPMHLVSIPPTFFEKVAFIVYPLLVVILSFVITQKMSVRYE